jgi:hypothetical protein
MRNVGVALIVAVYAVLFFTSSSAPVAMSNTGLVATRAQPHLDPMMTAIAVAGIMLAVIPLRRGERWAQLTTVAILILVLVTRYTTSGQRLVVLDPNRHGYSLVIVSVLAIAGLFLTGRFGPGARSPHGLK